MDRASQTEAEKRSFVFSTNSVDIDNPVPQEGGLEKVSGAITKYLRRYAVPTSSGMLLTSWSGTGSGHSFDAMPLFFFLLLNGILLTGKFPYWAGRRLKATYNSRSQNNQTHLHPLI
ncbi:hypothetical protein Syun_031841 [Stephania yunnanensis]|uniref:Uncharacterized protein n=1 Tax=Stephania yunnanensis TaxID=152371 RepID=A0AAP0E0E3_9MAGN